MVGVDAAGGGGGGVGRCLLLSFVVVLRLTDGGASFLGYKKRFCSVLPLQSCTIRACLVATDYDRELQ